MTHAHPDPESRAGETHWLKRAACADHPDRTLWDADVHGETPIGKEQRHEAALAVCAACPVIQQCRATRQPGDEGVRGGIVLRSAPDQWVPRELQPCGTEAAYKRHKRRHEPACAACLSAIARVRAARRPAKPGQRRTVAECNTIAGYHAHHRRGEPPCTGCADVHRAYQREWRQAKRARLRAAAMPA